MRFIVSFLFFVGFTFGIIAQTRIPKPVVKHPQDSEAFIKMLDETFMDYFGSISKDKNVDSIIRSLELEDDDIGEVSEDVYCQRLEKINALSPFQLDCNDITLGMIRFFVKNRRGFAKIVLGRSKLYFDLYETMLAKHDMPIELKYLSVIESGLRPQVKSPAGALGLWQFMYGTGKMYGLVENSYIDERMDPYKSTEAACLFLKKLYGIYGDWNLALAAYNAGPGNVNKAIRRSGGKRTYWEVRPFLPRETQGYVPNFIAATYLLYYFAEHNIKPAPAKTHYFQLDSICLSKVVHMATIDQLVGWPIDEISAVNPVYKLKIIPNTNPKQCIYGPMNYIGKLVSLEDSLYTLEQQLYAPKPKVIESVVDTTSTTPLAQDSLQTNTVNTDEKTVKQTVTWHKVRRGETLTSISQKYTVNIEDLRKWNYLRSYNAPLGRNLKIINGVIGSTTESVVTAQVINQQVKTPDKNEIAWHKVVRGETLNSIAVQYGVTIEDIRKWNYLRGYTAQIGRNLKIINPKKDLNAITQTSDSINNVYSEQSSSKLKTTTKTVISTPIEKPLVLDSIVTIYHTVQRNESIGLIAAKYDVLPEDIKKWNNLSTNWIGVSQKLKILINVKLIQPELTKEVLTKQVPEKVLPKKKYYSVKPGDLFNRIADKNGISPEKLRELNPKINPNSIRVGELIRVK